MTTEEIQALITMSDEERVAWLNGRSGLTSSDLSELRAMGLGGAFASAIVEKLGGPSEVGSELDAAVAPMAEENDRARSQIVRDQVDAGLEAARGTETPGGATITPEERAAATGTEIQTILPLEIVRDLGVDASSEEEALRVLDMYNDLRGTSFTTWDDLAASGVLKSELERAVLSASIEDPEPEETYTVSTFKGRVQITKTEMDMASESFGLTPSQIGRTAKLAAAAGFMNMDGQVAWQPAAALFKAAGFSEWGRTDQESRSAKVEQDRLAVQIQQAKDRLKTMNPGGEGAIALQKQIDGWQAQYNRGAQAYRDDVNFQPETRDGRTPQELADDFNEQLALYQGDEQMALLGTLEPGLAARIRATGGDPGKLTWQDRDLLGSTIRRAGFTSLDDFAMTLGVLGRGEALDENASSPLLKRIAELEAALSGGGGGAQRILPDPVQVTQAAKDMYRSLFLEDPDEATLASFSAQINSIVSAAPSNQNVDVSAQIRGIAEKMPQYQELYGKRPSGVDEADYRAMMESGQRSMLGNELAGNAATKLGMRSGKYQTAVGATMGTSEAWDNSTFMGRLAAAAQVVGRNT